MRISDWSSDVCSSDPPEAIKLFPVIHALRARDDVETRLIVTAQHRGLLDQVLEIAGIAPDIDLDVMTPNQTLDGLTAKLIVELRSEERRVGKGGVSTCRSRWSQ